MPSTVKIQCLFDSGSLFKSTVESRFFKLPREAKIGLRKRGKISVFDEKKEVTFGFRKSLERLRIRIPVWLLLSKGFFLLLTPK